MRIRFPRLGGASSARLPSLLLSVVVAVQLFPLAALAAEEQVRIPSMESAVLHRSAAPRQQPQPPPAILAARLPEPPETVLPKVSRERIEAGMEEFGPRWLGPTLAVAGVPGTGASTGIPGLLPGRWSIQGRSAIWRATLRSPGAHALRLHFSSFDADGSVYLRPAGATEGRVGPYSGLGPQQDGDFWAGIVHAEAVTIEYVTEAAAGTISGPPPFRVKDVAHVVRPLVPGRKGGRLPGQLSPVGSVPRTIAGCHLDATCHPKWVDRDYTAVVLLAVSNASASWSCTGSIINTRYDSDDHLLLLTAGHCVESQDDAENATFYWNYQTTECYGQTGRPSDLVSTTGATLISSRDDRRADYALLRLDHDDVLSVTGVRLLGWDPNRVGSGTPVVAVSHPTGDFKRISFGSTTRVNWTGRSSSTFTGISWRQGTTESGSSGAGVRRESDGALIGVTTGSTFDPPCDREYRSTLNHFSAIYDEISEFLESEDSVSELLPKNIVISLGSSGSTVTIAPASNGTFEVLGGSGVSSILISPDGSPAGAISDNGNRYLFSYVGGVWTANFDAPEIKVSLPATPGSLSIYRAEDGSQWLGDVEVSDGFGVANSDYGTYRLVIDPSKAEGHLEPVPAGIPFAVSGLSVETFAGTGNYGIGGDGGHALRARLANPTDIAVSPSGDVLIADTENHRIRRVNSSGIIVTVAGSGSPGFSGDSGRAARAQLREPRGIAIGPNGDIYFADTGNHRIRVIQPDGTIDTVAGSHRSGFGGDGGPATDARLEDPSAVAVDRHGNLYIADTGNNRIRKVTPAYISTIAGTGRLGYGGDGGSASRAPLRRPKGVAVDRAGNVYIADTGNHRIRRIDRDGIISTLAGTGVPGFGYDRQPALSAQFNSPQGLALAPDGSLYVADTSNDTVRQVTRFGTVVTVVDGRVDSNLGFHLASLSDGAFVTVVGGGGELDSPTGVAFDTDGRLLVANSGNRRVQRLEPHWQVFSSEDMPTPELVQLSEPGDWARVWRTADGTYYHRGRPIETGEVVWGWNGESYRLENNAISGWLAEPVELDHVAAFEQDRIAAGTGDPSAQAGLGWHYATGNGVEKNPEEALRWFRSAADQGNAFANYWLGIMYEQGRGVQEDAGKAFESYLAAARQGHAGAQYETALNFRNGYGVDKDLEAGYQWHLRAAMQDHQASQRAVAYLLESGEGVTESLFDAFRWNRTGADNGNPWSQAALGRNYLNGDGVTKDTREAFRWLSLSSERGNSWAQANLGYMYEFGDGVRTNYAEAVRWFRRSAEQGRSYSQWRLGLAFMHGRGTRRNDVAALVWLGLARSNGESRADEAWNEVRSRLTAAQLRDAAERGQRCEESDYQSCP